jgi:hypothetical protein
LAVVELKGLRELNRLLAATDKQAKRELNRGLRKAANPIKEDAQQFAESGIRRIGPKWGKMRVGVTQSLVYVAPKERGVKTRGPDPRRRPKFANLMEERAMDPALRANEHEVERQVDEAFEKIAHQWNRR